MEVNMEEMRQQMSILKKKLEKQIIVNDRLIRRTLERNVVKLNRRYLWLSLLCIGMIPFGYYSFVYLNRMSVGFWLYTSLMMVVSVAFTYWNGQVLRDDRLLHDDLLEAYRKIAKAKKRDNQWLLVGIPWALTFAAYFCYEIYRTNDAERAKTACVAGAVGAIVGMCAGLKLHFKTQRNYREILEQIADVTEE